MDELSTCQLSSMNRLPWSGKGESLHLAKTGSQISHSFISVGLGCLQACLLQPHFREFPELSNQPNHLRQNELASERKAKVRISASRNCELDHIRDFWPNLK